MEDNEQFDLGGDDDEGMDAGETDQVWDSLSSEQKKFFKKLAEKSEDNMRYIG
jgi:hypothetical protein